MYLVIMYKRSFHFSRRSVLQSPPSINWGFFPRGSHTTISSNNLYLPIFPPMANHKMEFTRMQESLNKLWDNWNHSIPKEGVSIFYRSLVPPTNNVLIFRFLQGNRLEWRTWVLLWTLSRDLVPQPCTIYAIGEEVYLVGFENSTDCNKVIAR